MAGALWDWQLNGSSYILTGWNGLATKTGVTADDLRDFVGVPLEISGSTPVTVPNGQLTQIIRYAEDEIEAESGVLLTPTRVAAPSEDLPAPGVNLIVGSDGATQVLGVDYDIREAGYDFYYDMWIANSWGFQTIRKRPVQQVHSMFFMYPILNQYFNVPSSWITLDHDSGLLRVVPSTDTQMLPLFEMTLTAVGFADTVPGALHFQYDAGFTPEQLNGRWSFVKQCVLAAAAKQALATVQGSINLGKTSIDVSVDGLRRAIRYAEKGPYAGLIAQFDAIYQQTLRRTIDSTSGPVVGEL